MMLNVLKIVLPSILTFFLGILITPFFSGIFYKYKMWKKSPRTASDITAEDFAKIHNTQSELSTPRVGGIIIWASVLLTVFVIFMISVLFPTPLTHKFNFFSRSQTLVPLATLVLASIVGLIDDLLQISGEGEYAKDKLMYRKVKIISVCIIGLAVSSWFYFKLGSDYTGFHIPFWHNINLGIWFIPFFITIMLAVFSTSVIDGIDGLSGGVTAPIFTAYAIIAFVHNQIDIAAFCAVMAAAILAFLWFNIPPARFYMGETGILGITATISVIAFLTNSVLLLPIIAFPLMLTSLSVIVQMISYRFFDKHRIFKVAPLHHHFQAMGWSREKVVMRYWIIGVVFAIIGSILVLVS